VCHTQSVGQDFLGGGILPLVTQNKKKGGGRGFVRTCTKDDLEKREGPK
jgi:hypothetical protein